MKLLTNPSRCPACGHKTVSFDIHRCLECETPLFKAGQDYGRFQQETSLGSFYVFFSPNGVLFRGWVHSGHLEAPAPRVDEKPMEKPALNNKPALA